MGIDIHLRWLGNELYRHVRHAELKDRRAA